ncbi:hypothetical protein L1987_01786 [Smallanthus sonchifolius]|uniref:Uncharacterized protein n=1 Tax=Smallanthus sonchifolius TaxID=185202 RepID=A0ACB9K606_9ASTR|nr:hypothetical protein L1987_01786 [Smallanthus sonchifolius]
MNILITWMKSIMQFYIATNKLKSAKSDPFFEEIGAKGYPGDTGKVKKRENRQEYILLCDWMKRQLSDKVAKVQISDRISDDNSVLYDHDLDWREEVKKIVSTLNAGKVPCADVVSKQFQPIIGQTILRLTS